MLLPDSANTTAQCAHLNYPNTRIPYFSVWIWKRIHSLFQILQFGRHSRLRALRRPPRSISALKLPAVSSHSTLAWSYKSRKVSHSLFVPPPQTCTQKDIYACHGIHNFLPPRNKRLRATKANLIQNPMYFYIFIWGWCGGRGATGLRDNGGHVLSQQSAPVSRNL